MPSFPGGETELMKYVSANLKYPEEENEKGIYGRVSARFVVGSDGVVRDIEIIKSTGSPIVDDAFLKLIKQMPKWEAGRHEGKAVPVYFTIPLHFRPK